MYIVSFIHENKLELRIELHHLFRLPPQESMDHSLPPFKPVLKLNWVHHAPFNWGRAKLLY
jgi:hypothetical protein